MAVVAVAVPMLVTASAVAAAAVMVKMVVWLHCSMLSDPADLEENAAWWLLAVDWHVQIFPTFSACHVPQYVCDATH